MIIKQHVNLKSEAQSNIKLRIEMLKDKAEQNVPLARRRWLLEMINELLIFS